MNKTISLFALFIAAAPMLAASTCETRVDKNPSATTAQRVQECLREDVLEETEPQHHTILTDVYTVKYPAKKIKEKNNQKTVTVKKYKKQNVNTELFDQNQYPALRNDIFPNINADEVNENALEAVKKQNQTKKDKTQKPAAKKATKPARKIESPSASADLAVPTQTPPAEIQQAQALENNPLYPNYTDSAAPAGFTDDGLLGPADFGNNATDPALKPY